MRFQPSRGLVSELPGGLALLIELLEFALLATGMALLFRFVPNTQVRWRHAWAGACSWRWASKSRRARAGLVREVAVPTYSIVYGAFATLPIFLLWIYIGWLIVLSRRSHCRLCAQPVDAGGAPARPARRTVCVGAVRAGDAVRCATNAVDPGCRCPCRPRPCASTPCRWSRWSTTLVALDWCGRLDEGAEARYVLLIEPSTTPAAPLLDRLLLAEREQVATFRHRAGFERLRVADLLDREDSISAAGQARG
jgi:membrane protein